MNAIHTAEITHCFLKEKLVVLLEHEKTLVYPPTSISVSKPNCLVNHTLKPLAIIQNA
jgi:hypothetical protein